MAASQLRLAMLSVHSSPIGNIGARDTGGMSIYVREVAREIGKRGVLVDVYTCVPNPNCSQIVALGENARLIHIKAGEDGEIDKLAIYPHLPTFARNLEDFRRKNNLQYDLIFSHYWLSGWVGNSLKPRWHVPHLLMFHTIGAVKNAIGIGEEEPMLRLHTERELARNGLHIIAATEKEKADLVRHYDASLQRISVIPCGVNLSLFRPIEQEIARQRLGFGDQQIILFVGRIEPLKGISQLIQAMTLLPGNQKPMLVIIGGDEHSRQEMAKLQQLSRKLQIADAVSFLGAVNHEELPNFYSAADVCVIPSYYESFGLVALESLACGTPVVATNVGDLQNIICPGKTGYVVGDNEPHNLANRISLVLSQPGGVGKSALIRASVTRFSWSNIAQALMAEYQRALTN